MWELTVWSRVLNTRVLEGRDLVTVIFTAALGAFSDVGGMLEGLRSPGTGWRGAVVYATGLAAALTIAFAPLIEIVMQ